MHFFLMISKGGELWDLYGYMENMLFLKNFETKGENFFYFSNAYFKGGNDKDFKIICFQSKIILIVYYFYPYKSNVCYHQKGGDCWLFGSQS